MPTQIRTVLGLKCERLNMNLSEYSDNVKAIGVLVAIDLSGQVIHIKGV
jgi:hypothetical protein